MCVVQALTWSCDDRSSLEPAINGVVRLLSHDPNRRMIVQDLRDDIGVVPAWMYPWSRQSRAGSPRCLAWMVRQTIP